MHIAGSPTVWYALGMATAWAAVAAHPIQARYADAPPQVALAVLEQDLGTVVQGEAVIANFPIQNVGDRPLVVRKESRSRGSSSAAEPLVIEPGEVRVLHVFAETSRSLGTTVFQANYRTNAPSHPRFSLKVRLRVERKPQARTLLALAGESSAEGGLLPGRF